MGNNRYYVVFVGRQPGVYASWPLCQLQVNGFPGNVYKGYELQSDAVAAYNEWKQSSKRRSREIECGEGSTTASTEIRLDCNKMELKEPITSANSDMATNLRATTPTPAVVDAFCLGCLFGSLLASSAVEKDSGGEESED